MAVNNLSINSSGYSIIKFGSTVVNSGTTFKDVSISGLPSTYYVVATPESNIGVYITNKTTSGFRINTFSAPASNMNVNYIVIS